MGFFVCENSYKKELQCMTVPVDCSLLKRKTKGNKMKQVFIKKITKGEYLAMVKNNNVFGIAAFKIIDNSYGIAKNWTLETLNGKELNCWTTKKSMVEYLATRNDEEILKMVAQ